MKGNLLKKKVTKKSDPFSSIQLAKGFSMESFALEILKVRVIVTCFKYMVRTHKHGVGRAGYAINIKK